MARSQRSNATTYWCNPCAPGVGLLRADFTNHEYRPHFHSETVIAVTEAGGAIITSRGIEAEARPDTLFLLKAGEVQSARMGWSRRWVYRAFYFGQDALEDICCGLGHAKVPSLPSAAINDEHLIAGFRSLHYAFEQQSDVSETREWLTQTFARMFARCGMPIQSLDAGPHDSATFRTVAAFVRARRLDELHLDELAAVANVTIFQLIRLFKRVAGLTPHAYLVQLRLDDARRHLRNGMAVAEAAAAAGFYDQSALTNHFRRSYGITPGQYAAAVRR